MENSRAAKYVKVMRFPLRVVTPQTSDAVTLSGELEFDDAALEADHRSVGAVTRSQFGKNILHSALNGFFTLSIADRQSAYSHCQQQYKSH